MDEALKDLLDQGLESITADDLSDVDQSAREQLLRLVGLLNKWNRVYNLTAVRDPAQMLTRHLLDSLVLRPWLPAPMIEPGHDSADAMVGVTVDITADVLDIGSGAGLPVLPLAIVHPELSFVSVESNGKKTRFQQQVLF